MSTLNQLFHHLMSTLNQLFHHLMSTLNETINHKFSTQYTGFSTPIVEKIKHLTIFFNTFNIKKERFYPLLSVILDQNFSIHCLILLNAVSWSLHLHLRNLAVFNPLEINSSLPSARQKIPYLELWKIPLIHDS
jgi:hypothetical protein